MSFQPLLVTETPKVLCKVMPISSLTNSGIGQVWATIEELISWRKRKGYFELIRDNQKISSFNRELNNAFQEKVETSEKIINEIEAIKHQIHKGIVSPEKAAEDIIKKILAFIQKK